MQLSSCNFFALCVAASFKHVRNFGDITVTKLQVVYMQDFEVAIQSATQIAESCVTKIACVNGTLNYLYIQCDLKYKTFLF